MKKTIKTIVKAAVGVVAAGAIVVTGLAANEIFGNPISKYKAEKTAVAFVEENYPELNYELGDTNYDFKAVRYKTNFQSLDSEDTAFIVACDRNGNYSFDDYDSQPIWNAAQRFEEAAEKEINPCLIEEFGEKSNPGISLLNDIELAEAGLISVDQPVDLNNFPFEVKVYIDVFTDEENYDELIADTIKRINSAVDDRFSVGKYSIEIKNADGTETKDYVFLTAKEAETMYQ